MSGFFTFIASMLVGYFFFLYLSHPKKKKDKLPNIKIKGLEVLPSLRFHIGDKIYHFHHWFYLLLFFAIAIFVLENFQLPMVAQGLIIGGIIQGLRYPDRFKFRYPKIQDIQHNIHEFQENIQKEIKIINKNINKNLGLKKKFKKKKH